MYFLSQIPPEAKWWGSLDIITSIPNSRLKICSVIPPHRIITIRLTAPTLVPSPPCTSRFLSILILISFTLLDIGSNFICLFHAAYWQERCCSWDLTPKTQVYSFLGFSVFGFVLVISIVSFVSLVIITNESVRMSTIYDHKLKVLLPAPPSKL